MTTVEKALVHAAEFTGVPLRLLKAVCKVESALNPKATHYDDGGSHSYGLCQIKLETARSVGFTGSVPKLYNPYVNAYYAGRYLKFQLVRYRGDWVRAISAYNAGHAKKVIKNRKYVNRVIQSL
jgi:soluble lytic murein transglycosylase-like protein